MNTINASIATNPFLAKSENSANSSNVKLDNSLFDSIDSKTTARRDDTVGFSSKGQFMINIQRHVYKLSDAERNQFVDVLEQSSEQIFDENFFHRLRNPMTITEDMLHTPPEMLARMKEVGSIGEVGIDHPKLTIGTYAGVNLIGKWNFRPLSSSSDIHETDQLTRKLDQLTAKASKELSDVDSRTIAGVMSTAVKGSRSYLNSSYALFRGNYDYEVAEQAISKLPMSDGLKEDYRNLLTEIRSFQHQLNSDYIAQQQKKIQSSPQFASVIKEEIQTLEEGLQINKELQQSISHSQNGLFGAENHFQILMRNAESIQRDSSEQISDMFNCFTDQLNMFDRIYIEKDWGTDSSNKLTRDPVMDLAFQETQELTSQYIVAINSYMANQNTNNS